MRYQNSLKQLGLFSFLILTILLDSCKKPEAGIGQDLLPPEDELFANANDTTEIYIGTALHPNGKIRTDVYTNCMIGNYVDPVFGEVKATSYLEFDLSSDLTEFPEEFDVTKVVLNLVYFGREYGLDEAQEMDVRMLTEGLDYDSAYYSNSDLKCLQENLMVPGFELVNMQSENQGQVVLGRTSALALNLRKEFGEFLLQADSTQTSSLANFKNYFKGLRVGSKTSNAQVVNFDLEDTQTVLSVYYNVNEADTIANRQYDFIISDSCKHFTRLDHIRTGTALETIQNTGELDGTLLTYPQSGGSTVAKVNLENMSWLRNEPESAINQAWLVMPYDTTSAFAPIDYFTIHYYDENGDLQILVENAEAVRALLRSDLGYYYADLTRFVQDYANGYHNYSELFLLPQVASLTTQRTVIHGTGFNVADKSQNTRLIITYSK